MDSQECSWYLDNLARVEKYKEKVLKYQNAGKTPPTLEDFFGARDCSMINRYDFLFYLHAKLTKNSRFLYSKSDVFFI